MATLYGHGKGKARSHAPTQEKPYWITLKPAEVEDIIVNLSKEGLTTAKIGLVLRDRYGIPDVKFFTGKKINKILSEKGVDSNKQDLQALEKRDKILQKHIEKNKGDITAKKGSQFAKAKIKRLKDYYSK